ncbi:MAG: hypothetical protein IIA75_01950 [Proteobacteria bacterium]|nr:hypothetical protein [Pseudomonadota bacterium]
MAETDKQAEDNEQTHQHWHLFRDLLAFQFKLALDALRDLMLSPLSLAAVLAGLIKRQDDPGKYFRDLLQLGHRSDRWINLFGTAERDNAAPGLSSDTYVRKVEDMVIKEYKKGGLVKNLKDSTDGLIGKIRKD